MSLYSQWQELINAHTSEAELRRFWDGYFKAETEAYKKILSAHKAEYAGREEELAKFFGMPAEIFIGFIDGINTSLRSELPLEEIEKDTEIKLDIDFEKLYFNMHEAKADWLYNLREWDGVLSSERRREITKQWRESKQFRNTEKKIGPNDPCPCGSGKKYKKCCGKIAE